MFLFLYTFFVLKNYRHLSLSFCSSTIFVQTCEADVMILPCTPSLSRLCFYICWNYWPHAIKYKFLACLPHRNVSSICIWLDCNSLRDETSRFGQVELLMRPCFLPFNILFYFIFYFKLIKKQWYKLNFQFSYHSTREIMYVLVQEAS